MKYFLLILVTLLSLRSQAERPMTLDEAIRIAQSRSPYAQLARLSFMSQYWNYRSYKAQFLPSLNLDANLANYNRSLEEVRDYNTGEIRYVANNTLTNSAGLSINQNIPLTGGRISFNTNLYRLDQFDNKTILYNSRPFTINYSQPLRAFNDLKWQKRTAPKQYEKAKRNYLESCENITITVTNLYFSVLSAQTDHNRSVSNAQDTRKLYEIAQKRFAIGTITKSELMQLELSMLNSDLLINSSRVALDMAEYELRAYLGIAENDKLQLAEPKDVPLVSMKYEDVLERAYRNSSFRLTQDIKAINAARSVAQSRAQKGLKADLNVNLGASQSSSTLSGVYRNLKDQEIVGVTLSMPIFDWGLSRGRVRMAQAEEKLALTEVEQEEQKFKQDVLIKVMKFNNQASQCSISRKAMEIADERYNITYQRFENGSVTVTELNTAQKEQSDARSQYVNQLRTFWSAYYELQKMSLYNFITNKDLSAEFDKIVE